MQKAINSFSKWNLNSTMWLWFIPTLLITFFVAWQMVKYAEGIIKKTRFGGAFVGGVLVSITTSIPELVTEIIQGRQGTPAVGISDDIGANAFTTFMIGFIALIAIRSMFLKKISKWTRVTIAFSLGLSILMTIALFFSRDITIGTTGKFAIGLIPILFFVIYLSISFLTYRFGFVKTPSNIVAFPEPGTKLQNNPKNIKVNITAADKMSAKKAIIGFIFFSILTALAALLLNFVVNAMQLKYLISSRSTGGIFLSMTTALPEVVALIKFVSAKHASAAVSSIIGSHILNYSLFFFGDLAYSNQPILEGNGVNEVWPIGLLTVILLSLLGIMVLFSKRMRDKRVYAIIPTFMVVSYFVGWALIIAL